MTFAPSQITIPRPSDVAHLFTKPARPSIADEYGLRQTAQPIEPDEEFECCKRQCPTCLEYDEDFDPYCNPPWHWCEDEDEDGRIPNVRCDDHGYMFDLYDAEIYSDGYCECGRLPEMDCPYHGHFFDNKAWFGYTDWYDYHDDNFGHTADYFDEEDASYHEIAEFYDSYLRDDSSESTSRQPWWWNERARYYDEMWKWCHREAVRRSPSHRRRDLSVHARGSFRTWWERKDRAEYLRKKYAII